MARRLQLVADDEATQDAKPATAERMSDEELKTLVSDKLRTAMGAPGSEISRQRLRNLDAYLAEPEGEWAPPEIDDRSALVATDVADTVEWMLPSLLRVFAASKDAIEAAPRRPQYEPQAHLVRETLRWLFWDKLDGVTFLHSWFKDGLIEKVGFARVGCTKAQVTVPESYRGLTEAQAEMLVRDDDIKVVGQTRRTEQTDAGPPTVVDVDIERLEPDVQHTVEAVPPEEMRVDNAARYSDEPRFIAQVYRKAKSELLAEGYAVEHITSGDSAESYSQEEIARRQINTRRVVDPSDGDDEDPMLEVVDAYLRRGPAHDARYERALLIGGELIERDECDSHPFVWWCPAPMSHVFFGHCPADQAIEPQRLRTRLLRAVEDNVYLSVNGRTGVVGGDATTIDDILDSRPGGIVRLRTKDDLVPIVQPDLSPAAWNAVEWAEQWTEKRTGFSRLSKGLSSEALNETATGVLEITERADMRVELIARHAAAALGKLLTKLLKNLSQYQDVSQAVRINGGWVDIDPRDWAQHFQVSVRVGLGAGNKDRQVAQLTQLQAVQLQLMQGGMVPPPAAVALSRKLAEAMNIESPEQFFPDPPPPGTAQPPLPLLIEQAKGQVQQQIEGQRTAAKLQERQAELQVQAANDARDADRERQRAELDAQLLQAKEEGAQRIAMLQAQNARLIAEMQEQTKLQIAAMQAGVLTIPQFDVGAMQRLEASIQALIGAVNAPKAVVRDPATNRVVGVAPAQNQGMQ